MIHLCTISQYPFTYRAQVLFVAFLLVLAVQSASAQGTGAAWRAITSDSTQAQIMRLVANDSAVFAIGRPIVYRVENNRLVPFTLNQRTPILYATPSFHFAILDSSLWRSRNGHEWVRMGILPSDVFFMDMIASENEKLHYAATTKGVYRSSDSGRTWQSAWLPGVLLSRIAIVADTIYTGGGCGSMQRSIDGGKTWAEERFPYLGSEVYCLRNLAPFLNGIYAHLTSEQPSGDIYRYNGSDNILVRKELIGYLDRHWLTIAFTTRKGEILCAAVNFDKGRQAILRSSDGKNWDSLTTNNLTTNTYADGIAANSHSVFITANNGMSLFIFDAPTTTVAVRETTPLTAPSWSISPNPTSERVTVHLDLPKPARVRCTLHNALGQEVTLLTDGEVSAGAREISANVGNLPQGLYICRVAVSGETQTSKSIIISR